MPELTPIASNISAILLAAGESKRMGQQKALLPWHGVPLIQYQIQSLLDAGAEEVVIVLGYHAETLRPLVEEFPLATPVLNLRYRTGRSSSVRAGLRRIEPQATDILVLGVDQPRSPETIRQVIGLHRRLDSLVTYPAYHGKGGHPIIFARALMPELLRIRESRQGMREVVERHRSQVARFDSGDPEVLLDLNRPEEYQQAVEEAGLAR